MAQGRACARGQASSRPKSRARTSGSRPRCRRKWSATSRRSEGSYTVELNIGSDQPRLLRNHARWLRHGATCIRREPGVHDGTGGGSPGQGRSSACSNPSMPASSATCPDLQTQWIYRVNDGTAQRLGGFKQISMEKNRQGHLLRARGPGIHAELSPRSPRRLPRRSSPLPTQPPPYYEGILGGEHERHEHRRRHHHARSRRRWGHRSYAIHPSFLGAACRRGLCIRRMPCTRNGFEPDNIPDQRHALHRHQWRARGRASGSRPKTKPGSSRGDQRRQEAGPHSRPNAQPGTWVAQAIALRKLLATDEPRGRRAHHDAVGDDQTIPPSSATRGTKVLAKSGDKQYKAHVTAGDMKANVTIETASGIDRRRGNGSRRAEDETRARIHQRRVLMLRIPLAAFRHLHGDDMPLASKRLQVMRPRSKAFAKVDEIFADYALDSHVPGLVYGVVADGQLVHVRGIGVQDLESKRPVTPDTLFRIASMTKAFTALTILKLRDEETAARCARGNLCAGNARLEIPDAGFAAHSRARPAESHRGLRHRRSRGAIARRHCPKPSFRGCCVRACRSRSAGHGDGVFESRFRAARTDHHECVRTTVRGHYFEVSAAAARHAVIRLRRRRRAARASSARLSLGR